MILKSNIKKDFNSIYKIINEAAFAYKGIIPKDRWKEPYISKEELKIQINEGVEFWNYQNDNEIIGVMGIQFENKVTLIRHAYIKTFFQQKGIGSKLLIHLIEMVKTPVLIGTWADASWAINFYKKHGFKVLSNEQKNNLLNTYWKVPERQMQTSVILASKNWKDK